MIRRRPSPGFATVLTGLLLFGVVAVHHSGQNLRLSGDRAFSHVERLVSYGPRPPASPGIKKAQEYITGVLRRLSLEVEHQNFLASTPNGNLPMKNIIGRSQVEKGKVVILASHYDKPGLSGSQRRRFQRGLVAGTGESTLPAATGFLPVVCLF